MTDLDTAIYRQAVRLYPHGFWRTFHDELESDFDDGRADALEHGWPALCWFWLRAAGDLIVSLIREWLRTPWIPVLIAAASISLTLFSFAAFKVRQWPQHLQWPPRGLQPDSHADSLGMLVLLIVGALIPIVGTILGSMWMLLLQRRVATRKRRRV